MPVPVLYEVNVEVDPSIATQYLEWLRPHVAEMHHQIHGLLDVRLFRRSPSAAAPPDWVGYTVTYTVVSMEVLDDYITNRSAPMRQHAFDTFGEGKIVATRRIMDVLPL